MADKYKICRSIIVIFFFLLITAGVSRAAFEFRGSGARSASLAGAYTAVSDDAEALWWNPAGLRIIGNVQMDASYTNLYGMRELAQVNLSLVFPTLTMGTWGLGFSSFGSSDYRETDMRLAFAAGLGSGVYFGTNLKSNMVSIDGGAETAGAFGLDVGLLGNITEDYSIGISAYNLNRPSMASNPVEYLQQRFMVGLYATPVEGVGLSVDMHKVRERDWEERIGLELPLSPSLRLRAGVQTRPTRFSFGFGLDRGIFTFNYANFSHHILNSQHMFSLQANFGPEEDPRTRAGMVEEPDEPVIDEPEIIVNINTADLDELTIVPGLGPTVAGRIIEYREEAGDFKEVRDLMRVYGFTRAMLERFSPYLTVDREDVPDTHPRQMEFEFEPVPEQ